MTTPKPTASDNHETTSERFEEVRVELAAATECCRARAVGPMLVAIRKALELAERMK